MFDDPMTTAAARRRDPRARIPVSVGWLAILLLGGSLLGSGCGYSLAGRGTFLPDYIETIGIPLFVNNTTFFEIEQLVTDHDP